MNLFTYKKVLIKKINANESTRSQIEQKKKKTQQVFPYGIFSYFLVYYNFNQILQKAIIT